MMEAGLVGGEIKPIPVPEQVLGFYDVSALDLAMLANEFDMKEEMEAIIGLCRSADEGVRLSALKHLRNVVKEVSALNGMFGKAKITEVHDERGVTTTRTVEGSTLVKRLNSTDGSNRTDIGEERFEHNPSVESGEGPVEAPAEDDDP